MEDNPINRRGGAQLVEDFITHALVGASCRDASGLGRIAGAFGQREAFSSGALARHPKRRGLVPGIIGMLARWKIELLEEGAIGGGNGRKCVGLEPQSGR